MSTRLQLQHATDNVAMPPSPKCSTSAPPARHHMSATRSPRAAPRASKNVKVLRSMAVAPSLRDLRCRTCASSWAIVLAMNAGLRDSTMVPASEFCADVRRAYAHENEIGQRPRAVLLPGAT